MGAHDRARFATASWLASGAGSEVLADGTSVTWSRSEHAAEASGILAFDFSVAPAASGRLVFGFAIDPDLGKDAADDMSGYDATRSMTYAYDDQVAFGVIIRGDKTPPASIWQYGTTRFAPRTTGALWDAQRMSGRHLIQGKSDVQFVVSMPPQTDTKRYTVIMIEGKDLIDLQRKADEVSRIGM